MTTIIYLQHNILCHIKKSVLTFLQDWIKRQVDSKPYWRVMHAACLKLYDLTMKSSTVLVKLVSRDLFSKACSQNIVKQTQYHIHLVIWHFSKAMWSHIFIGFCHCSFKWISANRFPCSSILMTLAAFLFSYIIFPLWLFWI